MAALPETTPSLVSPWWHRPVEMNPVAVAAAAAGLLALGTALGASLRDSDRTFGRSTRKSTSRGRTYEHSRGQRPGIELTTSSVSVRNVQRSLAPSSDVNRATEHGEAGFLGRFRQRRVRVDGGADVVCARPRYSKPSTTSATSSDTFGPTRCAPSSSSVSASAMNFTNPAVSPSVRARAFAEKGNLPTLYGRPCGLDLVFGEAHGGDLGPGVDDRGNRAVVHAGGLAGDHLRRHHPFLLGLVGEQLAAHRVADRVHVRQVRPHAGRRRGSRRARRARGPAPPRRCPSDSACVRPPPARSRPRAVRRAAILLRHSTLTPVAARARRR